MSAVDIKGESLYLKNDLRGNIFFYGPLLAFKGPAIALSSLVNYWLLLGRTGVLNWLVSAIIDYFLVADGDMIGCRNQQFP